MSRLFALAALLLLPVLSHAAEPEVHFAPGETFQQALVKELLGAKKTIDIALYSFQATSKQSESDYSKLKKRYEITPLDALREAIKKKVKVRVVLNHARHDRSNQKTAAHLLEAGARVYTVGKTMHSKYAIVDGETVINGSGNWSIGAFNRYHENWIVFPPDEKLAEAFERNMDALLAEKKELTLSPEGTLKLKKAKKDNPKIGKAKAGVYFTSDNDGEKTKRVEDLLVDHMRKAKKSLTIAVAHYNTKRLADEAIKAHERGLKVRILVDLGEYSNRVSQASRLEKAKVEVRYQVYSVKMFFPFAQLMHHKLMIVDGKTLITGSYNWSRTAEWGNHENVQVLTRPSLLKAFEKEFERLWTLRRDVYPEFMKKVRAKDEQDPNYRRYLPVHFPPMALTGKEMASLRRAYIRKGFAMRPWKGRPASCEFWNLDQKKRAGVNELPEDHTPFFDDQPVETTASASKEGRAKSGSGKKARRKTSGALRITEVCHSPSDQTTGEFVELYNAGKSEIDLTGYVLADGTSEDPLIQFRRRKTTLDPGQYALIVDPEFEKNFKLPHGVIVVTVADKTLGNGLSPDDTVVIQDAKGDVSDSVALKATGEGESVQRKSLKKDSAPSNFKVAKATPGIGPK